MIKQLEKYVIDANVFIQPHRSFYGLDFCPGYWNVLEHHHNANCVCSIDKVRGELEHEPDALWLWAKTKLNTAFLSTGTNEVASAYSEMATWVTANPNFTDTAKAEFLRVADGWLAAYAKSENCILVTMEKYNAARKSKVQLPNLCEHFDIEWITPFEMLRRLNVQLVWTPPA